MDRRRTPCLARHGDRCCGGLEPPASPPRLTRHAAQSALRAAGLQASSHNAALLAEPWEVSNKTRRAVPGFTPFWKALGARGLAHGPCAVPSLQRRLLSVQRVAALAPGRSTSSVCCPRSGGTKAWRLRGSRPVPPRRMTRRVSRRRTATLPRWSRPPGARLGVTPVAVPCISGSSGHAKSSPAVRGERVGGEDFLRELGWREFAHICCITSRTPANNRWMDALRYFHGAKTRHSCGHGSVGEPASRWSMPACAS